MKFHRKKRNKRSKQDKRDDALRDNYDDLVDEVTESDDTDKSPSKVRQTIDSLRPDGHRKMERTILFFSLATTLFVTGVGVSAWHYHHTQETQSETLTPQHSMVNFSKTAAGFQMGTGVLSEDKTTYYLPVTFNNMSVLSTNANHYGIFVSATNGSLGYKPRIQLLMYGSSGRAVFIVHSPTGFVNQPITVYIKNEVDLSTDSSDGSDNVGDVSSDAGIAAAQEAYDLAVFKTNLGKPAIPTTSQLSATGDTPTQIYKALFTQADKDKIQANVNSDEKKLPQKLKLAKNLYARLKDAGYKMPSEPDWLSDSWRPKDMVDTTTGEVGDSGYYATNTGSITSAENYFANHNSQTQAGGAQESPNWPTTLKKKNGESFSTNNTGSEGINGQGNGADATVWSNLQQTWSTIQSLKRDIYVTQNANFYAINNNLKTIGDYTSLGQAKHFRILGNVSIK